MELKKSMELRPYQQRAVDAVAAGWGEFRRQLGIAATGGGKTVIFAHIAAAESGRTLILAHREELVKQAAEKLHAATGIFATIEQGAQTAMPGHGVVVGSIQSVRRRLRKYARDAFDLIICDEAHHSLSEEWQEVLGWFESARVLGVTATPDRSDRKSLGVFYQNVAFEIGLLELIGAGHLCNLRALRLPVEIDARSIKLRSGADLSADVASELLEPRLREVARAAAAEIWDRKTLVFLPRCDVSEKFAEALAAEGIQARHVAGDSDGREEQLAWFRGAAPGAALCNAMLLTEGYDQPDIDCILCLRPTKSRALYCQIVGRGTRTSPGKDHCLLLDPLWLSGELNLCQPADISAPNPTHKKALQAHLDAGAEILEAESRAKLDVETALAAQLEEAAKNRKAPKGLVDPLAWAVGIHDSDLEEYEPTMPWEEEPPTEAQLKALSQAGIWTDRMTRGFASKLLERLGRRAHLGLATPKQVILLRRLGNPNAETMTKDQAGYYIGQRIGGRS
jgi:superfamily II DNA or RNA helicase